MASSFEDRLTGIETGVAIKAPVLVASTANLTLSGEQTIDGVSVVANDRVLVKDQTDPVENGIWTVSAGAWSRAKDFDGVRDAVQGTRVLVISGTLGARTEWQLTTADPVIGVSSLTFAEHGLTLAYVTGVQSIELTGAAPGVSLVSTSVAATHDRARLRYASGAVTLALMDSDDVDVATLLSATAGATGFSAATLRSSGFKVQTQDGGTDIAEFATGAMTVTGSLTATGALSGATIAGAMVSTNMYTDRASTTKVPQMAAITAQLPVAWCAFTGSGSATITESYGVTSVVRNATGDYDVTLTNTMASNGYAIIPGSSTGQRRLVAVNITTTGFKLLTEDNSGTNSDASYVSFAVYGALA